MWEANAAENPARGMSGAERVVQAQAGCLSHCPQRLRGAWALAVARAGWEGSAGELRRLSPRCVCSSPTSASQSVCSLPKGALSKVKWMGLSI